MKVCSNRLISKTEGFSLVDHPPAQIVRISTTTFGLTTVGSHFGILTHTNHNLISDAMRSRSTLCALQGVMKPLYPITAGD